MKGLLGINGFIFMECAFLRQPSGVKRLLSFNFPVPPALSPEERIRYERERYSFDGEVT